MKAVVYREYGPPEVLHVEEIAKPVPKDREVLIRVKATPVNYGDVTARKFGHLRFRDFNMPAFLLIPAKLAFGLRRPRVSVLGSEFAGVVEETGKQVRKFRPGDPVFGYCGMAMGANAEFLCMPEDGMLEIKPAAMSFEEASGLAYGGIMAMSLLRRVRIKPGDKVLILGASGGIGAIALQLAKSRGAAVTGVCGAPRLDYVKSLGADKVIDYAREEFTQNGETYDLIFDILGKGRFSRGRRSLAKNGCYLLASFKTGKLLQMLWTSVTGGQKVICAMANEDPKDMTLLKELAEAGKLRTIVDQCFPLEQAAQAHRVVEQGLKKGSVVITVAG